MKLFKLLIPFVLTLSVFALPGCGTTSPAYPTTTIETEELVTTEAEEDIYAPILLSRQDQLTPGTSAQIEAHNNVYWCRHVAQRPLGFDPSVCEGQTEG